MTSASSGKENALKIIVGGYLVRGPLGGSAWVFLHYALGFLNLGHDVYFVEDSGDDPWCCYEPSRGMTEDPTFGLAFTKDAFRRAGFGDKWAYFDAHTTQWLGPASEEILHACKEADLFVNLSGENPVRPWFEDIPVRVFVDLDPLFTQVRHLTDSTRHERAEQHNVFMSFGENIGVNKSEVPDDGFHWKPTRPPIVLDAWTVTPGPKAGSFSTVMQWDSYPEQEYGGVRYGMKSRSFDPYIDLPETLSVDLELSVGSSSAPRDLLRDHGWKLSNPLETARDPWTYQTFIRQSRGEFAIAKQGYVASRSGWFSDRSAAYMASGRPVIVENTAFDCWLPTGKGVLAFSSPHEARDHVVEVDSNYEEHCRAARELVEEYFDSRRVLHDLVDYALSGSSGKDK